MPRKKSKSKKASTQRPRGRERADRRERLMQTPTKHGYEPIRIRGSKQAKILARYTSAVGYFLRTGEPVRLAEFEGEQIGDRPLITDPKTLAELAEAGSLTLDELYIHPGPSR